MQRIVTAAQMKRLDRKAIDEYGIPGMVLMENAGRSVCDSIEHEFDDIVGLAVAVVCGKGNNGGDGLVITRHLLNRGAVVTCFLLGRVAGLKGDARANADMLLKAGIPVEEVEDKDLLVPALESCDVVVDAIFGTGLDSAPKGLFADVIELINRTGCFVVSVDIPSGVNADTGQAYEPAVISDLTVTMALPKYGHVLFPGRGLCGDVEVCDIGIPEHLLAEGADTFFTDEDHVFDILADRPEQGHKGTFGTALIIAGARGFSGAVCLAGMAAVRSGCGLVKLACPEAVTGTVEANVLEAVKVPLPGTDADTIAPAALSTVLEHAQDVECVAIGPGITTNPETAAFQLDLLPRLECPVIIDADGINNLAGRLEVLAGMKAPVVLTPHPGECPDHRCETGRGQSGPHRCQPRIRPQAQCRARAQRRTDRCRDTGRRRVRQPHGQQRSRVGRHRRRAHRASGRAPGPDKRTGARRGLGRVPSWSGSRHRS
jgi:hydroxyethylthiazole kinase-like uncharacterized protein yjeF